jgi:hypothetical protein
MRWSRLSVNAPRRHPYALGMVLLAGWLAAAVRRITIVLAEQMRNRCHPRCGSADAACQPHLLCNARSRLGLLDGHCRSVPRTTGNSARLRQWAAFGLVDVARDPAGAFVAVPWPFARRAGRDCKGRSGPKG